MTGGEIMLLFGAVCGASALGLFVCGVVYAVVSRRRLREIDAAYRTTAQNAALLAKLTVGSAPDQG